MMNVLASFLVKRLALILLLTTAATTLLTSCVRLAVGTLTRKTGLQYQTPEPPMYADKEFTGLRSFIADARAESSILLIHGVTDKKTDHYDLMVERLAHKLNLRMLDDGEKKSIKQGQRTNDTLSRILGFESWQLFEWKFFHDSLNKHVSFYFLYWAPVTRPAKDFIHEYNKTEYRTGLASLAKDSLFINLFGDLALSINPDYKFELQNAVIQSLNVIKGELAVIGGGFGVQLVFDAIQLANDLKKGTSDSLLQIKNRGIDIFDYRRRFDLPRLENPCDVRKVFMTSNQMPFLSLLTLRPTDQNDHQSLADQVYWHFRNFVGQKQETDAGYVLELVSFFDPNDPFGYELPRTDTTMIDVKNVSVNIAEYFNIDPRKTTEFVLPQIKEGKAADLFLNVIDQKFRSQKLLFNLTGPANQSRNDYRVMGAILDGSRYDFLCTVRQLPLNPPRDLEPHRTARFPLLTASIGNEISWHLRNKLDIKKSILPFGLPSEFRDNDPNRMISRPFEGMDKSIEQNELTQIITVHGVRNQKPDHFDQLTNNISAALGFYAFPDKVKYKCAAGESCDHVGPMVGCYRPGTIKISEFKNVYGKRLIIYNVYWSSITLPAKQWLDTVSISAEGSVIPKLLKQELISDGFADIELTFQEYRGKVDSTIARAFTLMDEDFRETNSKDTTNNTYFITGSLGSRLLLDFVSDNDTQVNRAVVSRTETWFMLTNQLIMTALKDFPANGGITYEKYFQSVYQGMTSKLDKPWSMRIVAFNDPNDILSFIVPDEVMGVSKNALKVHNNYLNLTQGLNVNMDALIKFAWKADQVLQNRHWRAYRKRLDCLEDCPYESCSTGENLSQKDNAYQDVEDVLNIAQERFLRFKFFGDFAPDSSKIKDDEIIAQLKRKVNDREEGDLRRLFKEQKKWTGTELYVTREEFLSKKKGWKNLKKAQPKKTVLRKLNFRRLFEPGLIMPFLRQVSNYMHYQDFVSDFGNAHVGTKENSKIIQMMAHGFDAVTKTNVDQKLYEGIHNVEQKKKRPPPPKEKKRKGKCKNCERSL